MNEETYTIDADTLERIANWQAQADLKYDRSFMLMFPVMAWCLVINAVMVFFTSATFNAFGVSATLLAAAMCLAAWLLCRTFRPLDYFLKQRREGIEKCLYENSVKNEINLLTKE